MEYFKEKMLIKFIGHNGQVNGVAITGDSKYVVSASNDKTLRVWNVIKKQQESIIEGANCDVSSVVITRDNKNIISGDFSGNVRVQDLMTREEDNGFKGKIEKNIIIAMTKHREFLNSKTEFMVSLVTFIKESQDEDNDISNIVRALKKNSKVVIYEYKNCIVRVWDMTAEQQMQARMQGYTDNLKYVPIYCESLLVIAENKEKAFKVWELSNQNLRTLVMGKAKFVNNATVTRNCKYIVAETLNFCVIVFKMSKMLPGNKHQVLDIIENMEIKPN